MAPNQIIIAHIIYASKVLETRSIEASTTEFPPGALREILFFASSGFWCPWNSTRDLWLDPPELVLMGTSLIFKLSSRSRVLGMRTWTHFVGILDLLYPIHCSCCSPVSPTKMLCHLGMGLAASYRKLHRWAQIREDVCGTLPAGQVWGPESDSWSKKKRMFTCT